MTKEEIKTGVIGALLGVFGTIILSVFVDYIKEPIPIALNLLMLLLGILVGIIIGILLKKKPNINLPKINITDLVIFISLILAIVFTIGGINNKLNEPIFAAISNFYVSFIFAWLLTKKTSKESYEQEIEKTAIMSYKQLHNLEGGVRFALTKVHEMGEVDSNIGKESECESCNKESIFKERISRVADNLVNIIQNIDSSKTNWSMYINDKSKIEEIKNEGFYYDEGKDNNRQGNPNKEAHKKFGGKQKIN